MLQIAQLDGIDGPASALSNEADSGHGIQPMLHQGDGHQHWSPASTACNVLDKSFVSRAYLPRPATQ